MLKAKSIAAIGASVVLAFALAGCGSSGGAASNSASSASSEAQSSQEISEVLGSIVDDGEWDGSFALMNNSAASSVDVTMSGDYHVSDWDAGDPQAATIEATESISTNDKEMSMEFAYADGEFELKDSSTYTAGGYATVGTYYQIAGLYYVQPQSYESAGSVKQGDTATATMSESFYQALAHDLDVSDAFYGMTGEELAVSNGATTVEYATDGSVTINIEMDVTAPLADGPADFHTVLSYTVR